MRVIDEYQNLGDVGTAEIGIEVEMEGPGVLGGKVNAPLGYWRKDKDGSLRGESCEYVLAKPVLRHDVPKALLQLRKYLLDNMAQVNDSDRCGVHVHLNFQKEEVSKVLNVIMLYLVFEDLLVRYCGESREGNLFCLRARDAESMLLELYQCKVNGRLSYLQHDAYRYASLNVSAIQKYGSLEFRSLKTPKDVTKIEPWVNMLLCIKDYGLNKIEDSASIVENLSRNGEIPFLKLVMGNDENLIKPLLKGEEPVANLMRQGVRRIQHIAYAKEVKQQAKKASLKGYVPAPGWGAAPRDNAQFLNDEAFRQEIIRRQMEPAVREAPAPKRRRPVRPAVPEIPIPDWEPMDEDE